MTKEIVERTRTYTQKVKEQVFPDLDVPCPNPECRTTPLRQTDAHYSCPACRFRIGKVVASRPLSEAEAKELVSGGTVGPLKGFRSRFGREFSASLHLDENLKVAFIFEDDRRDSEVELKDPIGPCPLCAEEGRERRIHATEDAYVCEEHVRDRKACPARLPRTLCRFEIPREQALKFFNEGRTDVIDRFISKKGRPFKASLVLARKGRRLVQWEFPPREAKGGGGKKAPRKRAAAGKLPSARKK